MGKHLKKVVINNQKITYVTVGSGFPTIIILGWLASLEKFPYKKTFSKFETSYLQNNKLIFLHLSNFGSSDLSPTPYTLNDYTNELHKFINKLNLDKVNLVGHSAGGRHVLNYTLAHPTKVNKLILLATAGFTPKVPKKSQLLRVNFYFHKFNAVLPNQIKILQKTFTNIYKTDLRKCLSNISQQTLVIWGKKDETIKPEKAKIFIKKIPNSKLVLFKNLDHMLTYNKSVWKKLFSFLES